MNLSEIDEVKVALGISVSNTTDRKDAPQRDFVNMVKSIHKGRELMLSFLFAF